MVVTVPGELRFAVIALSKTANVGRDHLIHREAVPLPRKDRVESEEWRVELALGTVKYEPLSKHCFR